MDLATLSDEELEQHYLAAGFRRDRAGMSNWYEGSGPAGISVRGGDPRSDLLVAADIYNQDQKVYVSSNFATSAGFQLRFRTNDPWPSTLPGS